MHWSGQISLHYMHKNKSERHISVPGTLEVAKYLGAQMCTGKNAEKESLSKIFAESIWLVWGGGVERMKRYSHMGIYYHPKVCSVCQGRNRVRLIVAPMCLMISCGEKLMAQQGDSPLLVDFVTSKPLWKMKRKKLEEIGHQSWAGKGFWLT